MNLDDFISSPGVYEEMYEKYTLDPSSVDPSWSKLFKDMNSKPAGTRPELRAPVGADPNLVKNAEEGRRIKLDNLANEFRRKGHLNADFNPLAKPDGLQVIDPENNGFTKLELQQPEILEFIQKLKNVYTRQIGYEFKGIVAPEIEAFIQEELEKKSSELTLEEKQLIYEHLSKSELVESFMHTKFVGQKRFSLEGAETLIPMLREVLENGADLGVEEFVIGMAHRGRLNVLSNILNKSYNDIFAEFDEAYIPDSFEGTGDVKYHKGFASDEVTAHGHKIKVTLSPNPSHLESVDAVVEGQVKGKQTKKSEPFKQVMPILVHGDAALAGQGVVYETLQMQKLKGYETGGTLHFVINNQIGFTTSPDEGRSTRYCTDIAKTFSCPVFHVNAEDPEGALFATKLAVKIRQRFNIDVFIDIYGWRKYGHNESDEPAFTQPSLYHKIKNKKSIRELYRDKLIHEGAVEQYMAEEIEQEFKKALNAAKESLKLKKHEAGEIKMPKDSPYEASKVKTSVSAESLGIVAKALSTPPEGFDVHPKVASLMKDRFHMVFVDGDEKGIDWGMGELLAYGTLLIEGKPVRLAGQDVERGTFSHRHSVIVDQKNETHYTPLKHIQKNQAKFTVVNSHLSEFAALGFEYGYSISVPEGLTIWEAQFGDFANGAQVIIDQYIASSEQKWGQRSNVTLFLPHGYEGQGPEHSSGRLERFLTSAAHDNMRIANPTTPAQHFHLLRRQALEKTAKPLVVFTPKALLRLPAAVSPVKAFTEGEFQPILDDPNPGHFPTTLIFCSGKIYYEMKAYQEKVKFDKGAIIRIEQLYPLDIERINKIREQYSSANRFIWAQEEPENMGAYRFIRPYLESIFGTVEYAGRVASASPAAGLYPLHKLELHSILETIFSPGQPSNFEISGQIRA